MNTPMEVGNLLQKKDGFNKETSKGHSLATHVIDVASVVPILFLEKTFKLPWKSTFIFQKRICYADDIVIVSTGIYSINRSQCYLDLMSKDCCRVGIAYF